jgi:small subunit ribosomal protein S17
MAKAKEEKKAKKENVKENVATASATAPISIRGRVFEGFVTKKFPKRIVVEFERTVFIQKYERFSKKKSRLHARLPDNMNVNVGDYVRVQETRRLSKIIHFIVTEIVRTADGKEVKK